MVTGTGHGTLCHYLLPDLVPVNEYKHMGECKEALFERPFAGHRT